MSDVCYNPWWKGDRELISKLARRFLNEWMADDLTKDAISASRHAEILREIKRQLEGYNHDTIRDARYLANEVSEAIEERRAREEDDVLWVGLEDPRFIKEIVRGYNREKQAQRDLNKILTYLEAFKC